MNFLKGTYGIDILSIFLIFLGSVFNFSKYTYWLGLICFIYALYRALSKKIYKRKNELNIFCSYVNKLLNKFGKTLPDNLPVIDLNNLNYLIESLNYWINQKKNFKITKCPNCKQKLRLPRGKGKIVVTCKKCSTKFDLRT